MAAAIAFPQAAPRRPGFNRNAPWRIARAGLPVPGVYQWLPGELAALASQRCVYCAGTGQREAWGKSRACECVYRRVFRACLAEYSRIAGRSRDFQVQAFRAEKQGSIHLKGWHRPKENFVCDFELLAKRALTARDWRLFRAHFLEHCDQPECSRLLAISEGRFWHTVYRIERTLGWVYSELKPYPLWPIDGYFEQQRAQAAEPEPNPYPWQAR